MEKSGDIHSPKSDASRAAVRHLGGQTIVVMGETLFIIVGLSFQIYLARQLGTEGLGFVGIAEALVQTPAGFLAFGLAPLLVCYIPEYRVTGAFRAIRQLVGGGLLALLTMGVLGASVLAPLAPLVPDVIGALLDPASVGVLMVVRQLQQFPTVFHQIVLTVVSLFLQDLTRLEIVQALPTSFFRQMTGYFVWLPGCS